MIMWPFFFGGWRFHKELAHEVRCPPSPFTREEATRASYWLMCPQPVVAASNSEFFAGSDLSLVQNFGSISKSKQQT